MPEVEAPNWEGKSGKEHRTVGPHRAWCYEDSEWCYPVWNGTDSMLCHCCDQTNIPKRWRGSNVSTVLGDLRRQVQAEQEAAKEGLDINGDADGDWPQRLAYYTWQERIQTLAEVLELIDTGGTDG